MDGWREGKTQKIKYMDGWIDGCMEQGRGGWMVPSMGYIELWNFPLGSVSLKTGIFFLIMVEIKINYKING